MIIDLNKKIEKLKAEKKAIEEEIKKCEKELDDEVAKTIGTDSYKEVTENGVRILITKEIKTSEKVNGVAIIKDATALNSLIFAVENKMCNLTITKPFLKCIAGNPNYANFVTTEVEEVNKIKIDNSNE